MKLLNIFKKESAKNSKTKKVVQSNIHTLDKMQLEKVTGGTDTTENKGSSFASGLTIKVGDK